MTQPSSAWVLNPLFEDIKNPEELRAWLMRAYFNPTKHSGERYFRSDISKENILEYISVSKNKFPQTPLSIVEIWGVLPSLREGLRSVVPDEDFKEQQGVYTKGEKTLATIGQAIGGVTPTMVNKISDAAVLKMTTMLKAMSNEKEWLSREANDKIENAVLNAAEIFADVVRQSSDTEDALRRLSETNLLTPLDMSGVDTIEKDAIQDLIEWAREDGPTQQEIEDVFLDDIKKSCNVFNLMQLLVSRQVYPAGKRGRPKGNGKQND